MNPARSRHARRLTPPPSYPGGVDAPADGFTRIAPQHGTGIRLTAGELLVVVDPLGEQVSDLYAVRSDDQHDHLSAGRTIDHGNSLYVGPGSTLYSASGVPMAVITEDSVGVHDLTLTPCSQATFDLLYPELQGAPHRSCHANLVEALAPFGVPGHTIGTTFNIFMDVWTDAAGELHIDPPPTQPGDRIVLLAEVDLLVGLTACSAEKSNNGRCTPIDYQVLTP